MVTDEDYHNAFRKSEYKQQFLDGLRDDIGNECPLLDELRNTSEYKVNGRVVYMWSSIHPDEQGKFTTFVTPKAFDEINETQPLLPISEYFAVNSNPNKFWRPRLSFVEFKSWVVDHEYRHILQCVESPEIIRFEASRIYRFFQGKENESMDGNSMKMLVESKFRADREIPVYEYQFAMGKIKNMSDEYMADVSDRLDYYRNIRAEMLGLLRKHPKWKPEFELQHTPYSYARAASF